MKLTKSNIIQKYGITLLIMCIQILDIIVHALTNQLEMIRVQSNIIILLWSFFQFIPTHTFSKRIMSTLSVSIYLILNVLFLFQYGIMNSNGSYRVALIMFVGLTIALVFVQIIKKRSNL